MNGEKKGEGKLFKVPSYNFETITCTVTSDIYSGEITTKKSSRDIINYHYEIGFFRSSLSKQEKAHDDMVTFIHHLNDKLGNINAKIDFAIYDYNDFSLMEGKPLNRLF